MKTSPPISHTERARRAVATCLALVLLLAACGSSDDAASTDAVAATVDVAAQPAEATVEPIPTATEAPEPVPTEAPVAAAVDDGHDAERDHDADHDDADHDDADHSHDDDSEEAAMEPATTGTGVNVNLFFDGALVGEATTEACTLSGGAETSCYRITVAGNPVSYETGPFCPETITDTADAGGIWFDGTGVYDVDGAFIAGLAELYDDDNWLMYDADGNVLVTESAEEFDLAARPDVDPSLQNHCVEGRLEWLDDGEPISTTVLIPFEPVRADSASTTRGNLGVTLDGVVIAQSAPVDAILSAYTIAAFDDCGGHYNPNDGYHLHGAVGCSEVGEASDGETPMFAYAMDGFAVHSPLDDPDAANLDECNGHETDELGYHYHANGAEQNLVLECLVGQIVAGDDAAAGGRPDGPPPGADGERPDGPPPGADG